MSDITRAQMLQILGFDVSDEQWAAISAPMEPVVVVAGAGSGKTTSMSARVAWLVGGGYVRPEQVLGLTFTNKAAGNLLDSFRRDVAQVRELGLFAPAADSAEIDSDDELVDSDPFASTYHSFASRLISEHGLRLGREPDSLLLGDGAREQLAYRLICTTSLPLGVLGKSPATVTTSLLRLDDELAELDITPAALIDHDRDLIAHLETFDERQKSWHELVDTCRERIVLAELVLEWRALKAERDVHDFADHIRLALQIVRTFPEVAATLREQYSIVLLDEYQDTSIAQRRLLQEIFGGGHAVTAVGDPCQAIYGWRGASVSNIEDFVAHFPKRSGEKAERYSLSENRRSGPGILDLANEVARPLREVHAGVEPLAAKATNRGPGHVSAGLFETYAEELEWVADRITEIGAAKNDWNGIAVLAMTSNQLAEIDAALRVRGVPTQLVGAAGLLAQPVIVELRSILQVLHDPTANAAFIRLAAGPRWAIGPRDLAALGSRAAELAGGRSRADVSDVDQALDEAVKGSDPVEMISLPDAADDPGDSPRYSPEALTRFAELSREIRLLRRHVGEPLPELIGRILHVTGLETEVSLADAAIAEQQQFALSTFMSLASTFGEAEGEFTLGAFLTRLRDLERFDVDLRMDLASRSHQVQLMTVHKSKGLEFGHVFVPFVSTGSFPSSNGRPAWISNAHVVPWPLREDSTEALCSYPNGSNTPKAKEQTAYKAELKAIESIENQRLAYVAFTRAEYSLTVTGHWWGPTQIKPRGPSQFLESVHEACEGGNGEIITWAPKPDDESENPALGVTAVSWPAARDPQRQAALLASMQRVTAADPVAATPAGLSAAELERVTRWDAQIDSLIAELAARDAAEITVRAPESMSASALMRALTDPDGLAVDILRPMPSAPAPQARRGTDFHAWVETRFGQQSLLDPDDLPGAADHEIVTDEALADLKAAFEASEFARREPAAIERPFSLVLGGRVVRGRIDAVFANGDRFDVIDWKTGSGRGLDPMQLAIYRLAWSQLEGIPLERIDAAFYLVSESKLIRPESFPDLQALLDPR